MTCQDFLTFIFNSNIETFKYLFPLPELCSILKKMPINLSIKNLAQKSACLQLKLSFQRLGSISSHLY